jgi:hypothetical protein
MEFFIMGDRFLSSGRAVRVDKADAVPSWQLDRTAGFFINVQTRSDGLLGIADDSLTKMPGNSPLLDD